MCVCHCVFLSFSGINQSHSTYHYSNHVYQSNIKEKLSQWHKTSVWSMYGFVQWEVVQKCGRSEVGQRVQILDVTYDLLQYWLDIMSKPATVFD